MDLWFYKTDEFRGQKGLIDFRLLVLIDVLRYRWGQEIDISPHPKAIGRTEGTTRHNYKRYGKIQAIDLMPRGIHRYDDATRIVDLSKETGFSGIGFYPHWTFDGDTRPGIHVDVRYDRLPGNPALWGGIKVEKKQVYVSLTEALSEMKTETGNSFGI